MKLERVINWDTFPKGKKIKSISYKYLNVIQLRSNDVRTGKITIHEHILIGNPSRIHTEIDIHTEERRNYVLKWILRDTMRCKRSPEAN